MHLDRHITIIIPALNEEPSIGLVLEELFGVQVCNHCSRKQFIASQYTAASEQQLQRKMLANCALCPNCGSQELTQLIDRVIVCDNGSTDNTAEIARTGGALVTHEPERGYGAACLSALGAKVDKDIIVFVDADHSVVANEIPALIAPIFNGADLVIGSRTLGHTAKGALSIPQKAGNRIASAMIQLLWSQKVTDLGPFRAITDNALSKLHMSDRQFGWTVEMQVRALQESLIIAEVPVSTRQRIGKSKIGGTVKGVIGASRGILGTIARLYWQGLSNNASSINPKRN